MVVHTSLLFVHISCHISWHIYCRNPDNLVEIMTINPDYDNLRIQKSRIATPLDAVMREFRILALGGSEGN